MCSRCSSPAPQTAKAIQATGNPQVASVQAIKAAIKQKKAAAAPVPPPVGDLSQVTQQVTQHTLTASSHTHACCPLTTGHEQARAKEQARARQEAINGQAKKAKAAQKASEQARKAQKLPAPRNSQPAAKAALPRPAAAAKPQPKAIQQKQSLPAPAPQATVPVSVLSSRPTSG